MATDKQIQECKNLLQSRQAELIRQVQDHYGLVESAKEMTGELSSYDNHPAEMGTELFERGKDVALNEHAEIELKKINEALHAIAEGTYGVCTTCGQEIPIERLLAVPTAATCVEHGEEEIAMNERPVEEQTFHPDINPDEATVEDEEETGYDAEDAFQEVSRYGTSETPSDLYGDHANYDEMTPNSDEDIGTAEKLEGLLKADIYGREITDPIDE